MSSEVTLKGMDAIINKLYSINANVNKLSNQALKKAGEPVLVEAKSLAPIMSGNLKDGLKISGIKTKAGIKYVLVGIDRGDISPIFYGKFVEYGTSNGNYPRQPFLAPAYESKKGEATRIIAEVLKGGLK